MTLQELWELFPIFLVRHNEKWAVCYKEIETFLKKALKGFAVKRISHIGSTAIKGIGAKDIVDVLVALSMAFSENSRTDWRFCNASNKVIGAVLSGSGSFVIPLPAPEAMPLAANIRVVKNRIVLFITLIL